MKLTTCGLGNLKWGILRQKSQLLASPRAVRDEVVRVFPGGSRQPRSGSGFERAEKIAHTDDHKEETLAPWLAGEDPPSDRNNRSYYGDAAD
jgi:hypothetical protein